MPILYRLATCLAGAIALAASAFAQADDFIDLSLEDLLTLEVTSVAKKPQNPDESAAAVTVITAEDIRRSGAVTLPEILRLAPGVEVAEIDGNATAVSIRGFGWRFSNKLLVLIDGRAIYQPSISGIFWDQQLVPAEQIQRIEIVRGPGATMWGANAMNGVINIVTKHAADTLKGSATLDVGSDERYRVAGRYGFQMGDIGAARLYAQVRKTPSLVDSRGDQINDGADTYALGFRTDIEPKNGIDALTFQGEYQHLDYDNTTTTSYAGGSLFSDTERTNGEGYFFLGRWVRTFTPDHALTLQAYIDHSDRSEFRSQMEVTTYDIDFSHRFHPSDSLDIVWGLNARRTTDEITSFGGFNFNPNEYCADWFSGFVQAEYQIIPDRLRLTVGSKFEDNRYSDFEMQPSIRAIWLEDDWAIWAAASRAIRTPSRIETSLDTLINQVPANSPENPGPLPISVYFRGNSDFKVEVLNAYEAGFRKSWQDTHLDIALFHHVYNDLTSTRMHLPELVFAPFGPGGSLVPVGVEQAFVLENGNDANITGVEMALEHQVAPWWLIELSGDAKNFNLGRYYPPDSTIFGVEFTGTSPVFQAALRSTFELNEDIDASIGLRRISEFESEAVGAYTDLDIRASWRVTDQLELTLNAENLLEERRLEYSPRAYPTPEGYVERRVTLRLGARF